MKVCFTESEVEAIVLAHVQKFFPQANKVTLNNYSADFCRVMYEAPEPVQLAEVDGAAV